MSSTKQWFEDEEENRREAWIRARLSDPDLEDDSDEWQELEKEYDNYKDFMEDMAREEYEEQQWLKNNPHTDIYVSSISLLDKILEEGKVHTSETFYKMQIAYCITIMESCLGDMIKSIVLSDNRYRNYAVYQIEHLRNKEIKLVNLIDEDDVVGKSVQEYLTGVLYHKITIVQEAYKAILQIKKYKDIDTTKINELTTLRHDIVHRNGKTRDGKEILFEYKDVLDAFNTTKTFLTEMKDMISAAIKYHEEKQMNKDLDNN
ncbi:TPA: hypothetical protein ACJIYU_004456 [Yersinia enterocolitica]|uniref:hypothetical protein n=1 Tax=Yersinia intermedia TaxID=631 RepID=UPI0005DDC790|nr:hypothetical protein [Yersinia intermedia]HDL6709527.1 hypothetical protein [Yersinia enterocolitica]CQJ67393.1 Uncharacterised protein [Yersinia intermedia]HEN3238351.1 hypothetical protein [Yersinia enterocolitica]HEN3333800.1 hypothetical protein [Yersinia enterocolitica]HEN3412042.1 hypothetical protein [Yersinia enterocolitica]